MGRKSFGALLFLTVICMAGARPAHAGAGESRVGFYTESPVAWMQLRSVTAHAVVEGPLARTWLSYVLMNRSNYTTEVGFNLHVPNDTVLTEFGYYYHGRYIRGKMYDTDEAWKVYEAVTSRGRDPGIMDRPTRQDYHAQVFPVEPRHDLRVVIELVQALSSDGRGFHLEVPIAVTRPGASFNVESDPKGARYVLPAPTEGDAIQAPVDALVEVKGIGPARLWGTRPDGRTTCPASTAYAIPGGAAIHLKRHMKPDGPWIITIDRPSRRTLVQSYSAMSRDGSGFYALMLSPNSNLDNLAVTLRGGSFQSLPMRIGDVPAWDRVCIVGRYRPGRRLSATFRTGVRVVSHVDEALSSRSAFGPTNMASRMWAAKRIDALQGSGGNVRSRVVFLSKTYNVVSDYTALLAIPQEELERYRKNLAEQKLRTNTRAVGGGGGDPYISVRAPADARQVVAIFPAGETRSLNFNELSAVWEGRFDIPFGAPAGEYRVTVIVVHRDGSRSTFILVYENLLTSSVKASGSRMQAHPGMPVRVRVSGEGIARAVAVTPWGERVTLAEANGELAASLMVPEKWPVGDVPVQVILLDGAHNRTEITLDLEVR